MDVLRLIGFSGLITNLGIHLNQSDIVYRTITEFAYCMNERFACKPTVSKYILEGDAVLDSMTKHTLGHFEFTLITFRLTRIVWIFCVPLFLELLL